MKEIPQISESESEVMRLLWKRSPLTSNEIINELSDRMNWSDQTIKTFINRLLNKEAIRFEKSGRNYSNNFNINNSGIGCRIFACRLLEKDYD
jgi:BlaI family penicillinase repressor